MLPGCPAVRLSSALLAQLGVGPRRPVAMPVVGEGHQPGTAQHLAGDMWSARAFAVEGASGSVYFA